MNVTEFEMRLMAFGGGGLEKAIQESVATELKEVGREVAKTAAFYLGTYQPGWAPLADSTIRKHGDTPGLDSGSMRDDILTPSTETISTPGAIHTTSVGSHLDYAEFFELGTAKQPPRPFLSLALAEEYPEIERRVGEAVDKAIDDALGGA